MSDMLTAAQVRVAIFNNSIYASYDGVRYYADGISMQAIADELNATLGGGECEMRRDEHGVWHCLSCEKGADKITGNDGELESWHDSWPPNFCPYCGAKVVER